MLSTHSDRENSRRNKTNDAAPTKPNTANADRIVKAVCAALHFREHFRVFFRNVVVDAPLDFPRFASFGVPIQVGGWDILEIRILDTVSKGSEGRRQQQPTSLPNLLVADSFKTRLPMILATLLAIVV